MDLSASHEMAASEVLDGLLAPSPSNPGAIAVDWRPWRLPQAVSARLHRVVLELPRCLHCPTCSRGLAGTTAGPPPRIHSTWIWRQGTHAAIQEGHEHREREETG